LGPPLLLSAASLIGQREVFGDIKASSRHAAEIVAEGGRIFTNERYNDEIPVVKAAFWAGREALEDPEWARFFHIQTHPGQEAPPTPSGTAYRPGDVVLVHTVYAGGLQAAGRYLSYLQTRCKFTMLQTFTASAVPLLPDVMEAPGAHGSPLWWFFRYRRQEWATLVLRVEEVRP
jgi:hypothetical protein